MTLELIAELFRSSIPLLLVLSIPTIAYLLRDKEAERLKRLRQMYGGPFEL